MKTSAEHVQAHRARMSSKGYKRAEYQSDAPTASRIASLALWWDCSISEATRQAVQVAFERENVLAKADWAQPTHQRKRRNERWA